MQQYYKEEKPDQEIYGNGDIRCPLTRPDLFQIQDLKVRPLTFFELHKIRGSGNFQAAIL